MKPGSSALLLSLTLPSTALLLAAPSAVCQSKEAKSVIKEGEFVLPPNDPLVNNAFAKPPLRQVMPAKASAKDHNEQAEWLQKQGKMRTALAEYAAAIAMQPVSIDTMWALIERGDIYRDLKKWDVASADYNRASGVGDILWKDIEQKQEASRAALRAEKRDGGGFYDLREASFTLGLAMNRVKMGKARVLLLTGHLQESLDVLNKLMPLLRPARSLVFGSPPVGEPYVEPLDLWPELNGEVVRGTALIELRRYREALVDLNEGLRHEPRVIDSSPARYAEIYFNRGRAYDGLRLKDKALADFNVAVKLDPNYNAPLKHTSYFKKLTPRDPGKDDAAVDLSNTAAAWVLRAEEERGDDPAYSDALYHYGEAIALDATFAPAYEGRAKAYVAVANGNTDSKQYRADVYEANAKVRAQEDEDRAKADTALTQAEKDAKENERLNKVYDTLKELTNGAASKKVTVPAKPKSEPLPAEKRAEYSAKAFADFKRAVALEPHEPRWLESLITFEKATPAYAGNVAADEQKLAALRKEIAATTLDDGAAPEIIPPLWKVKP